jgi:hypothetical protein
MLVRSLSRDQTSAAWHLGWTHTMRARRPERRLTLYGNASVLSRFVSRSVAPLIPATAEPVRRRRWHPRALGLETHRTALSHVQILGLQSPSRLAFLSDSCQADEVDHLRAIDFLGGPALLVMSDGLESPFRIGT